MELEHREFLKSEQGRKWLIEKALEVVPKENNWQNFHTPYDLCEHMIFKTDVTNKSILVLFNIEFLEILIHKFKVPNKNIIFLADCRIESEMATKLYKVNNLIVNSLENIQEVLKGMKTFDLCFSNPPYGRNDHLKILNAIFPMFNEIIIVHPARWLLTIKKNQTPIFKEIKNKLHNVVCSFDIFNPNVLFGIDQVAPCCITHIDKKYKSSIYVNYFDQIKYIEKDINNITIFCDKWKTIVNPFKEKIEKYILENNGEIYSWNQRITDKTDITKIDKNKFFCQFTAMQPGTGDKTGKFMHGEDLYKIINPNQDYITSFEKLKQRTQLIFFFDSKTEVYNFLKYLKTDFVRFCLSIYKADHSLFDGALSLIPVMDFNQEWNDDKLFLYFNIPKETIDYITNSFPADLYGLRSN